MPLHIIKLAQPKPSKVFDTYWRFASERQGVVFNRLANLPFLTADPILSCLIPNVITESS